MKWMNEWMIRETTIKNMKKSSSLTVSDTYVHFPSWSFSLSMNSMAGMMLKFSLLTVPCSCKIGMPKYTCFGIGFCEIVDAVSCAQHKLTQLWAALICELIGMMLCPLPHNINQLRMNMQSAATTTKVVSFCFSNETTRRYLRGYSTKFKHESLKDIFIKEWREIVFFCLLADCFYMIKEIISPVRSWFDALDSSSLLLQWYIRAV